MRELTEPDRLLHLDALGKEIGHSVCARCGHDRFQTDMHTGGRDQQWSCANCGLVGGFRVVMDKA